jgi:hypothetical protein
MRGLHYPIHPGQTCESSSKLETSWIEGLDPYLQSLNGIVASSLGAYDIRFLGHWVDALVFQSQHARRYLHLTKISLLVISDVNAHDG